MILRKKIIPFIIFFSILVGTAYGFVSSARHSTSHFSAEMLSQQPLTTTSTASKDTTTRFPVNNQSIETYDDLNKVYPGSPESGQCADGDRIRCKFRKLCDPNQSRRTGNIHSADSHTRRIQQIFTPKKHAGVLERQKCERSGKQRG